MRPAQYRVVTVAREYGSGGAAIAAKLARRLGYELLDRALLERVAEAAQIDPGTAADLDERLDPWTARVARVLWRGGFDVLAPVDEDAVVDAHRVAALDAKIIREAADLGGCVIVGRGGQCVLSGREDVFHVFVQAPRRERRLRLRGRLGPDVDLDAAMEATDGERAAYVKHHFGCDWRSPRLYHLVLSSVIGEDTAVDTILAALGARPDGAP
jgi:cytidylate kinase